MLCSWVLRAHPLPWTRQLLPMAKAWCLWWCTRWLSSASRACSRLAGLCWRWIWRRIVRQWSLEQFQGWPSVSSPIVLLLVWSQRKLEQGSGVEVWCPALLVCIWIGTFQYLRRSRSCTSRWDISCRSGFRTWPSSPGWPCWWMSMLWWFCMTSRRALQAPWNRCWCSRWSLV